MTPAELFDTVQRQGLALTHEGEGIRVRPASRLPPEVRQAIIANRAEMLAQLAGRLACPRCMRLLDGKRRCWACCDRAVPMWTVDRLGHRSNGNRGERL